MLETREFDRGTSFTIGGPYGLHQSAQVLCPDAVVRKAKLIPGKEASDSIPGRVNYQHKTVTGYVTLVSADDGSQFLAFVPTGKYQGIWG